MIDPHRPRNIFQLLLADIFKCDVKFILRIFSHTVRHTDAARLAKCLEPSRNVDPIAKDIATFYDDVASIDANAELDPHLGWHVGVSGDHATLYRNGASHRMNHACKFHQHSVTGASDDPPAVLFDLGIEQRGQMFVQPGVRTLLISTHKPTVARHIGHENSTQSTFNPLCGHEDRPDPIRLLGSTLLSEVERVH